MKKLLCTLLAGTLLLCAAGPLWVSAAPAVFTDAATGIIVEAPEGAFPADAVMQVTVLANDFFGAGNTVNAAYEIKFVSGGAVVQPTVPVCLLVPVNALDPALEVYYIGFNSSNKTGSSVDMNSRLREAGGGMYWECGLTNLFGYFGVAPEGFRFQNPIKTIFTTKYESNFWNWFKFIVLFGWIWMWFI